MIRNGSVVLCGFFLYTKLPKKEQQFIYEQYKVLSDDSRSESDVDVVLIKPDHPENIENLAKI